MRKNIIVIFLLTFILCGCSKAGDEIILSDEDSSACESYSSEREISDTDNLTETANYTVSEEKPELITVYVCGAVTNPGVYELEPDCRINAAVEAAGGFSEDADTEYVNLAAKLQDGVKLQIPTLEESADTGTDAIPSFDVKDGTLGGGDGNSGLVNINTADKEALKTLPGIGDGIAGRIIEYRDKNGKFKSIEDIMNVTGIKSKLFSKFKDRITV